MCAIILEEDSVPASCCIENLTALILSICVPGFCVILFRYFTFTVFCITTYMYTVCEAELKIKRYGRY